MSVKEFELKLHEAGIAIPLDTGEKAADGTEIFE